MLDESMKKILAEQLRLSETMKLALGNFQVREMESISRSVREIIAHESGMESITRTLAAVHIRNGELMRAAIGPFEDIRKSGILALSSPLAEELKGTQQLLANYESRFRLPEISESTKYLTQLASAGINDSLRRYAEEASAVQKAMGAMRSPWLDTQETFRSITAFTELQGIGPHCMTSRYRVTVC